MTLNYGSMKERTANAPHFYASTGQAGYDAIAFSGKPVAQPLAHGHDQIQIVRHLGLESTGIAFARSHHAIIDTFTINLCNAGQYYGEVGGERVNKPLRRGAVSFVPAGADVYLEYPASHSALIMHFDRNLLRAVLAELDDRPLPMLHCEDSPKLSKLLQLIDAELRAPGFAPDLMIEGLIRALATSLIQVDGSTRIRDTDVIYLPHAKLRRLEDFVEANLDQSISLAELAALAGLSPFHFSRVFKNQRGETPCQFVRSRRTDRARRLLTSTDMPLAELALACGFANQSHFTAAFTRAMGIPPARYRRLATN
ncbi:MAG: AraC family transcriptional regulator [Sphingomonas sp.]|nr:AraC family transcriptional regulator [Sphingomonas sp.]